MNKQIILLCGAALLLILLIGCTNPDPTIDCGKGTYDQETDSCIFDLSIFCPEESTYNELKEICEIKPLTGITCEEGTYNEQTELCEIVLDPTILCPDGNLTEMNGELTCVIKPALLIQYCPNQVCDEKEKAFGICPQDCASPPENLYCPDGECDEKELADGSCPQDCGIIPPETHLECSNNSCIEVSGTGTNTCTTNTDCKPTDLSNIPYSFDAIHFEIDPHPKTEPEKKWADMAGMVELANQYNAPLTIMFWPGTVEYALSSPERLNQVREWQAQGHEMGMHNQGNFGLDDYCIEESACYKESDNEKYLELVGDYELKSGTIGETPSWLLPSFKYFAGGRFDGRTALILKYKLTNDQEVYRTHIRAGYFEEYPTGGTQIKIETYNTLNSNEIYGAVNHGEGTNMNGPNGYDEFIAWLEFLYEKDPTGQKRMTLTDLMENYVIPNNRYITWNQIQTDATPEIEECSVFLDTTLAIPDWYPETKLFDFGRCLDTKTYCKHEQNWCESMGSRGIIYLPRGCEDVAIENFEDFDYCITPASTCGDDTCSAKELESGECPADCSTTPENIYCPNGECDEKEAADGSCPQDCPN